MNEYFQRLLQASLEEAVEIQHSRKKPSRVTRYEVADVKAIREDMLKVTQAEFAATIGVSIDTIKSWESRRRNPAGLAAKGLSLTCVSFMEISREPFL
ncbi:TPA: helix-turn-helix domain-containing protein [Vibrio parahaemolyticus]|nr:helix-turn-helix domain-containing protein [Vibrio parahaemolyticus]